MRNYINELIERMFTMVQQQLPTGFRDDIGIVAERKDDVSQYVLGLCRNRQYTKISTPLVEYKDHRRYYKVIVSDGLWICLIDSRKLRQRERDRSYSLVFSLVFAK